MMFCKFPPLKIILLFLFAVLLSCESELDSTNNLKDPPALMSASDAAVMMSPVPECPLLTGYSSWDNVTMVLGESRTFAIETAADAIYQWTTSGLAITITSNDTANTVTIKAVALGSATLSVTRDVNGGGTCGRTGIINVVKSGGGNPGPTCGCPSGVIDDQLCVSGGHPYWRFQLTGVSSSDEIYWYGSHITVMSGQGGTYCVANPTDSDHGYFTLYCRITRRCSNGVTSTRTAYYTNLYGGSCNGGTTGYTGPCGGPILD